MRLNILSIGLMMLIMIVVLPPSANSLFWPKPQNQIIIIDDYDDHHSYGGYYGSASGIYVIRNREGKATKSGAVAQKKRKTVFDRLLEILG